MFKKYFGKSISSTLLLLSIFSLSCNSQNNSSEADADIALESLPLIINGTIKSNIPSKVYLERMNERNIPTRVDSVILGPDRTFSFNTTIPEPGIYQLNIEGQQIIGLILDGGETLNVVADGEASPDKMPSFEIEGSPNMDRFDAVMVEVQNFGKLRTALENEFKEAKNKKQQDELRQQYQIAMQNHRETIKPMIEEMGTSLPGIIAANNFLTSELDGEFLMQLKDDLVAEK